MMEFFISISFILLHNPSPIGMNGLQETAQRAKNHTHYRQQLISPTPFVSNLALYPPHDACDPVLSSYMRIMVTLTILWIVWGEA